MSRTLVRSCLLLLGAAGLFVGVRASSPEASSRRFEPGSSVVATEVDAPASAGSSLVDLSLPATPPGSREVLAQRLEILGAPADVVAQFVADVTALEGSDAENDELLASLAEPLGFDEPMTAKAVLLARALLAHEPVTLVGLEPAPEFLANVRGLVASGFDPDVATWLARQDLAADGVPTEEGAVLLRESGNEAAGQGVRREIDGLSPGDGGGIDGVPGGPMTPLAFCRTCPSVDVVLGTPATTWQTHSSAITPGSCKMYRFILAANKRYRFTFCEGGGTASFNTTLDAYGGNCVLLDSNNDNCGTLSQITLTTSATGYLYLKVGGNAGVGGSYTLAYREQPFTPPGNCTACPSYDIGTYIPVEAWQLAPVLSVPANSCRIVRFNVLVNHSYQFSTCNGGGAANFDTAFQLYTGACGLGPFNDDACQGGGSEIVFSSNSSQYVYLRVSAGASGGNVRVAYRDTTNICPAFPTFNFGTFVPQPQPWQTHSATFTQGQYCKRYRFSLVQGRTYRFTFCQGGGFVPFDSLLELSDLNDNFITGNNDWCGAPSEITYTAAYTGDYYLEVFDQFQQTGTYQLAYIELCRPCPDYHVAFPTPPNQFNQSYQTYNDWIPAGGCRIYAFPLNGLRRYRFTMCPDAGGGSTIDPYFELLRPNCNPITANNDSCGLQPEIDVTSPAPGTVYLRVTDLFGIGGNFTIAWADIGVSCPANDFAPGAPPAGGAWTSFPPGGGTLLRGGNQVLRLTGMVAAKTYQFSLCTGPVPPGGPDSAGFAAFDSIIDVQGPPGCGAPAGVVTAACGPDDILLSFTPAASGTYQFNVREEVVASGGAYLLQYRRITP